MSDEEHRWIVTYRTEGRERVAEEITAPTSIAAMLLVKERYGRLGIEIIDARVKERSQ